ncbi:MAG: (Fe-S)-binding protein [Candidatus Hodarchaeota archaeon]
MSTSKLQDVAKWVYICARCNSCKFIYRDYQDCCPAGDYFWFEPYWASGKNLIARALLEGNYNMSQSVAEKIYSCILCGNCEQQCEQDVGDHLVEIFEALRAEAIDKGFGPMKEHKSYKENIDKVHNPYAESHEDRFSEETMKKHVKESAEVVYFVGCTGAYREKEVVKSTISLLEKMGVDFAILKEEFCCGSPLLTTGQVDAANKIAKHNVDLIKKSGAKTVITSCAGCFRTLANQYTNRFELELPFKVQHFSEFLNDNVSKLKFKPQKGEKKKVTYHDPCHLGRHGGVYDAPRDVLKKLPGIEFVEMPRNREVAWCCGAGAGVKSAFKDFALETSKKRIEEAESTAGTLVTCCPFCERNLGDAIKSMDSTEILTDLCQLVDEMTE